MKAQRILIVEDDASIRFGLVEVLEGEGFSTAACGRGDEVPEAIEKFRPDLVLLDVMLPGRNGFELCKAVRAAGLRTPILMLTAKGEELDKVIGLDSGADDYVTKPFGIRELVARIHALLRRSTPGGPAPVPGKADGTFKVGEATVFPRKFQIERDGHPQQLTPKELGVLELLHERRGDAVSRDTLLDKVWGMTYYGTTRTVDQTVAQLRKKLGDAGGEPRFLITVHGIGYKLASDARSGAHRPSPPATLE